MNTEDLCCPECDYSFSYDRDEIKNTLEPLIEEGVCMHDIYCDKCGEMLTVTFKLEVDIQVYEDEAGVDDTDN